MQRFFLTYINEQRLFQKKDTLLVAVSGGIDSMVLLDLLEKNNFRFSVAHCNFQLRGEASDGDEDFVKNYCSERAIPFFCKHFDTKTYAETEKISTQMAARDLRYAWFEALRKQEKFSYLVTAHHLNDSIETVLLNLTKGTGIAGLTGIAPKRDWVVRPLLFATKEDVVQYAENEQIEWREDASNASNKYQRNLVRNEVIPLLKTINPSFETTFLSTLQRLAAVSKIVEKQVAYFKAAVLKEEGDSLSLDIETMHRWEHKSLFLEEALRPFGFNFQQVQNIVEGLDKTSGLMFESTTHTIFKDRQKLFVVERSWLENISIEIADNKSFVNVLSKNILLKKTEEKPSKEELIQPNFAFLDAQKITFPLRLRTWQKGDFFVPYGMKGKKLVSDYLIDIKMPLFRKQMQWVLTSATNEILWIVGHRVDGRFAVTSKTNEILVVEVKRG